MVSFNWLMRLSNNITEDSDCVSLYPSLQVPDGFISHFYVISEHVSPVLAFGFLGPRQHLSEVCTIFKVRSDVLVHIRVEKKCITWNKHV